MSMIENLDYIKEFGMEKFFDERRRQMDNKKTEIEDIRSTKKQLLRDPDIEPSSDVIAEALG